MIIMPLYQLFFQSFFLKKSVIIVGGYDAIVDMENQAWTIL